VREKKNAKRGSCEVSNKFRGVATIIETGRQQETVDKSPLGFSSSFSPLPFSLFTPFPYPSIPSPPFPYPSCVSSSRSPLRYLVWLGGAVVRAFDLRLKGRGFKSQPLHCRVQPCSHTLASTSGVTTLWRYINQFNLKKQKQKNSA